MSSMAMEMMGMRSMSMAGMDMEMMNDVIEACSACEQACTVCADSMMGESMAAGMARCMDTADMCNTMMRSMLRPNGFDMQSMMSMLEACVAMCRSCAAECTRHADMSQTCEMCATSCMMCADACEVMLGAMKDMHAMK